ncbi:zinc finger BED domain-containing protein RICESLEEPER 3-like [Papaver somniferum]|uniref:zinc finger BED domain-containing protein RICESLEEPER 3-like n=1 Tax=Papaver somniferum TaxID=3469 RepID=UPI000E6F62C7|nr:zinc finger BED domain-containing protein RICESLEEPER 3-like [Papaver somniferum]
MVEIRELMSTGPPIPSQDSYQSVQQRVSVVISPPPPPPPPPSSQPEVRESIKRNRTSLVWEHFQKSVDEAGIKWGKCNYCEGGKYRAGGKKYGTSNLNWHLTKCRKYMDSLEAAQLDSLGQPSNLGDQQQTVGVTFCQDGCRRALIKFIITDEQSFRMVEGEGFTAFCRYLESRFKLPSRMTVYRDIRGQFLSEKANLVNYFKSNKSIGEMFDRVGLERVFTITLDNASANKKAIEYIQEKVVSWGSSIVGGKHLHVRCAAHVLALVVKDGLKKYHTSVSRIRSVVKYVTASPARMKKFLDALFLERMEYKKGLVLDVKTRWNSIYLMLDAAEKYEKVFIRLGQSDKSFCERFIFDSPDESVMGVNVDDIDSTDFLDEMESSSSDSDEVPLSGRRKSKKKKPRVHAPEKYDWANARVLVQFLQHEFFDYSFHTCNVVVHIVNILLKHPEATVEFSGSTYVTSHTFLGEICDVRGELKEWQNAHHDPHLSHMGEKMLLKYNKYWGEHKNMNPLLFIAVLLDPREKERGLQVILEDLIVHDIPWMKQRLVNNWLDEVKKDFNELFTAYKAEYIGVGSVLASSESVGDTGGSPSHQSCSSSSTSHRKRRHKAHREEPRDILAIPVSSVASESAFSTGKRILGHLRSSLKPRTLEALILLQNWLRTPIDMDPSTFGAEEKEDDVLDSGKLIHDADALDSHSADASSTNDQPRMWNLVCPTFLSDVIVNDRI